MEFVGRERELAELEDMYSESGVKACVIRGRRRVGKSRLIEEFCEGKRAVIMEFSIGSLEDQLDYISDVVSVASGGRQEPLGSMYKAMKALAGVCSTERTVLVLDEFPNLVSSDTENIPSEVQRLVDTLLKGSDTMVIACGSEKAVMDQQFDDAQRPLYGRFAQILLEPLTLRETLALHPELSDIDAVRLYMVLGGIPYYHEQVRGTTFDDCMRSGFLDGLARLNVGAETNILRDLKDPRKSMLILRAIADGSTRMKEISERTGIDRPTCSVCISDMVGVGIVETVNPMYGAPKHPVYRIRDNYTAFCLEVLLRRKGLIRGPGDAIGDLRPHIETFLGGRFEDVCWEYLEANYHCVEVGRWWRTRRVDGGNETDDIDITARVRSDGVDLDFFCECKFRSRVTGFDVYNELGRRVGLVKGYKNPRYVLFSASGFDSKLSDYAEINPEAILVDLEDIIGSRS